MILSERAAQPVGDDAWVPPIAAGLRDLAQPGDPVGATSSVTFRLGSSTERPPDPLTVFAGACAAGLDAAVWIQPGEDFSLVGVGRAWEAAATGAGRFEALSAAWMARLAGARTANPDGGVRGTGPILIGGLGFVGDAPLDPIWGPFGASSMVLPELLMTRSSAGTWLTSSLVGGESSAVRSGIVDAAGPPGARTPEAIEARWRMLAAAWPPGVDAHPEAGRAPEHGTPAGLMRASERPDRATWTRLVGRFSGAVGRGRLDKVVLARRVDLVSTVEIDIVQALRRLAAGAPESTTFAIARRGSVFLGATPERLVMTEAGEFRTAAVAGSIGRGDSPAGDAALAAELLASDKDREEHNVVVTMLRAALEPLTDSLDVAGTPVVVPFRTVQHLVTPISGRMRERAGLLALTARLHPTPAVAGEPRDLALGLIAEHEGFERGWYAGPLGWLGADGDGELVVALRCGVVSGRTATLFAGCGIVADSDPDREWAESQMKLRVVAQALGELPS